MGMKEWVEKYYPKTAEEVAKEGVQASLEHALNKWKGARPEVLREYHLILDGTHLTDGIEWFPLTASTCALCVLFDQPHSGHSCAGCPLTIQEGPVMSRCWSYGRGWHAFFEDRGPDLMIEELEEALEKWKKENPCFSV